MKTCRDNINKLKTLCGELEDRDEQLKINASTLWDILSNIQEARSALESIEVENKDNQTKINIVVNKLSGISSMVASKGCKKVAEDA
ncbi:hypothetical protein CMI47_01875 [Candidatus Pacearchaeota archaeon]|nr:hypothetical protein [Candidatus Pacearchaeota archaeon]|tara:strand:- start:461 stop:721 length:261 start_codon:yes stop_codon:yes gene_type:complete